MIQAPQTQYMPTEQQAIPAQGAAVTPQAQPVPQQLTSSFYNYPTASAYAPAANTVNTDKAQYNGVNIEVINPQGQGVSPNTGYQVPAQYYPVAQPVTVPQAPVQQAPAVMPQQPVQVQQDAAQQPAPPVVPAPQFQNPAGEPVQAAAPVAEQPNPAQAAPASSVDPVSFANKLKTQEGDELRSTLEETATMIKSPGEEGKALLESDIVDALTGIINKDTADLQGPSEEVIALREKIKNGETLSEEDTAKANEATPLEKAEQNKQYALYTLAYMQNRLIEEAGKSGMTQPEIKDLPGINTVIDTIKENPDPRVRVSALAALSHIARPEYKEVLSTVFNLAKSDEDPEVVAEAEKSAAALQ